MKWGLSASIGGINKAFTRDNKTDKSAAVKLFIIFPSSPRAPLNPK